MIGPHFYFDLVRLPRKGWSTFFRSLYLVILLIGLTVMYEGGRHTIVDRASYARFAQSFAYTLIVMQDILILVLLPVYVSSAIAEERESQTLEALFISPLTNRQIVLGKFGGRLLHLAAVILAGVPLMAFMHMWGNVAISMLAYHLINTLLLAMTASSICILVSSMSETVFQAVTTSYIFVFVLGLVGELVAVGLPVAMSDSSGIPAYWSTMTLLLPSHVIITCVILTQAMNAVELLRRLETKPNQNKARSFSLADGDQKPVRTRKGNLKGSYINPLALPISEPAMFWKECLKDGTKWSLKWNWVVLFILPIAGVSIFTRLVMGVSLLTVGSSPEPLTVFAAVFSYTAYFVSLAAYFLVMVFQTTMCVAGEREQNTLEFLLLIPADRREILFCKWLGPLWKNWPLLAIAYLGVLLGAGCGAYSPLTALILMVLPWPFLLMCSFLGLLLSVLCRRTLFANIIMAGFLLLLLAAHIIGHQYLTGLFPAYALLMFEARQNELTRVPLTAGLPLVLMEQAAFIVIAAGCGVLAYVQFLRKDYQGKN